MKRLKIKLLEYLFYAGILSPKINDTYQWFSLDILDNNDKVEIIEINLLEI